MVVNPRSGDERPSADELRERARELGIDVHVLEPDDDAAEVARASGADVLGVAGGDGSLSAVAAVALERGVQFVCVPFGTRNHFARDLGLDRGDPLGVLAAFDGGRERRVDVGHVGERPFLNNVSLGLYARLVHRRERHLRRRHTLASARAVWLGLRDPGDPPLTLDGAPLEARVVLVANNAYELARFDVGARERLDEGLLHLYAARGLLPSAWEERAGERFSLGADGDGTVRAAIDGEPVELAAPLDFSIRPGALRVLLPPR